MRRRIILACLTLAGVLAALLPRAAWAAGCGVQDLGACVDGAQYTFWYGLATFAWSIVRTLLVLTAQLDTFRWWLVEVAFTSAYQVLTQLIDPLIVPFASVAIIVGCLALLLLPIFGRLEVIKLRQALAWVVIAPLLLTLSGPLIVQTEQLRTQVGSALFTGVSAIAPGGLFGIAGSDMAPLRPLAAANPCGVPSGRPVSATTLTMSDPVYAVTFSDRFDTDCAEARGPSVDSPDLWFSAAPEGPGYATGQHVADMNNAAERTAAVASIQRGAVRTFLAILPALLAVVDGLIQLVFALCLVALWISLPIGLLFVFFAQTADPVTGLLRRVIGVLQVSWSSSVVLGLVFACLLAAAELRNAAAYTGFALGALVLNGYVLVVAVDTFKSCLRTLSDTVAVATGLNPVAAAEQAGGMAATAAGLGIAAATGGAGMALAGTVAAKQTGSGRYAAGAMLGQFTPLAKVGEIAAAMGDSDELVSGMVAGGRSQRGGVRALAAIAGADNRRTDASGRTFRDHATERQISRKVTHRPTVLEELGAIGTAARAATDGTLSDAVLQRGRELGDAFQDRLGRVGDAWERIESEVDARSGGSTNPVRRTIAGMEVADRHLSRRGQTMHFDAATRAVIWSPRTAAAALPSDTLQAPRTQVRVPRLLTLGYRVQENDDGSVSFWQPTTSTPQTTPAARQRTQAAPVCDPQLAAVEQRLRLVEAGALVGDAAALRAEVARLQAAGASPTSPARQP